MPIAEIFISAFVTVLFEKVASSDLLTFAHREGVYKEIKKWSKMLGIIKYKLSDAEDQHIKNQAVKPWLEELQDLAYDLDDVLDEFAYEQIKLKLDGLIPLQPNTFKTKVKALLPSCTSATGYFNPRGFMFNSSMMSKINEISTRLESITRQINDLNLDSFSRTAANKPTSQRTPTTSLIHEPKICGRDKDRSEIIKLLLEDIESSQGNCNVGVIPITGMGGIGKTTLARAVYNDDIVKKHFDLRVWVCVSEEFDLIRITKAILESVTSRSCDFSNLDQIQVELKKRLAGRKFLIILDDVWHKDDHDWRVLKSPFCDAIRGSKVVVTTRDKDVAALMGSSKHQHYFLQLLPFEDCWSVFAHHAFENRNMNDFANLVEIGKNIVKDRCEGLPLSARALGALLKCEESEAEWKDVLDSKVWWEKDNKILPSLRLSYHHLPSYLKPCFAYCSILPKDYEFSKDELVLLWMAEGFIQQGREKKQLEDIGRDYFHELLARSLFQSSSTENNSNSFVMHDLVNDLAQEISGDLCFRLEEKLEDLKKSRNLGRARHSSFWQGRYDGLKKFNSFVECKCLRTFLPFSLKVGTCYLANSVPSILFPEMKRLRSLSLRFYKVIELPDSVGDMKHLRYLDLSFTYIETLPDWVQKLYNLQTLNLRGCSNLKRLPKHMGNLIHLRYFDITDAYSLKEMPLGIGNMESLHLLSNFIVTKDHGSRIRELGKLKHIGETLCISGLHNVTDPMIAKGAFIKEKECLNKLIMLYGATGNDIPNERGETEVLHMLQPHNTLKELHIGGFHGTRFPAWLEDPMFTNMVCLEIKNCRKCSVLPALGQLQSLKKLCIEGMSGIKNVDREFYGKVCPNPFPHLETLSFKGMPEWEDWFGFGVEDEVQPFPNVKELLIKDCPKLLGKLPNNLYSLQVLEIINCQKLVIKLDGLNYPSVTSFVLDSVELPFTPSMLSNMNKTRESSSLSFLRIKNVSMPDLLCDANISFQPLNSVKVESVSKLEYMPNWLTGDLTALKQLDVLDCKELKTLLDNSNNNVTTRLHPQFPVLQRLNISYCPELVSLLYEETEEESGRQQESRAAVQSFMKRLEYLKIVRCEKLEKLPRGLYLLSCLVDIEITRCDNLVSLPDTGFPPSLRGLRIYECKALESPLPCWNSDHNLEVLGVEFCPSLTGLFSSSFSSKKIGGLPSSLKRLLIFGCEKLEALFTGGDVMKIHCPSLEYIFIYNCGSLKYLPYTRCDDSLGKLKILNLIECRHLQYLPDGWFRAISSLSRISISGWRKGADKSVFSYILQEAVFLTNLTSLYLVDITTIVQPSDWGLHQLSSLRELYIEGPIRVAREEEEERKVVKVSVFPLDGMLLPTSLTDLWISDFPDLERLSSTGFQCLNFLEKLHLIKCPRFAYFPECGFPDTLLELSISDCPLLKKKCEKGKGKYMHILSPIPCVDIF